MRTRVVSPAATHATTSEAVQRLPVRFLTDLEWPVRIFAAASYLPCIVAFGSPATEFGVVEPMKVVTFSAEETQALALHANRKRVPKPALWRWTQLKLATPETIVRHCRTPDQSGRHDGKRTWYGEGKERFSLSDRLTVSALLTYFDLSLLYVHVAPPRVSRDADDTSSGDDSNDEQEGAQAR